MKHRISPKATNSSLQPGMIFTIEPGMYHMGSIGVRIEDDMLITEDGARSSTTFNRELIVL